MTQLAGSVVLITGAAGGFGREMVRQLLEAGSRLVLTDRDQAAVERVAAEAGAAAGGGGEVLACFAADLGTAAGCASVHAQASALRLPTDVLVNNAGIAQFGRFDEVPAEKWELLMEVNLMAPMRLTHLFLPGMVRRGRGHVVNISSAAGWIGSPGLAPYTASKFGLRGFGEALHLEMRRHGVAVTTVYPFFSRTPILQSEQIGSLPRPPLPDRVLTDPADVVREVLRGIREDRAHVFPDAMSRRLQLLKRFAPWALRYLAGRGRGRSSKG
ncbi:MAG TPA: SDR family NAD(P)-dependent oxidoreductase [Longimicrobiaceae bacterium]|nr:SDR family NAD(P)-dependent oxidoreductase [Longimicrobiaceae bacterium]